MNLKSGQLFWPTRTPEFPPLPLLERHIHCDVAVIGAGLTGSLVAHALTQNGVSTVLLDKRGVAKGSTSASTALIQYEIDVPLFRLVRMRGRDAAVRSYKACRRAIEQIEETQRQLAINCRFARRSSLYLARTRADVALLKREFQTREKNGFQLEFLGRHDLKNRYSISAQAALLSPGAAEIDPYRFTQGLITDARAKGLRAFAPATVRQIEDSRDRVIVKTESGPCVFAKKAIVAAGYESTEFLHRKLVRLRSTFVLTTAPVRGLNGWADRCLIWEAGRPYHYLRTTPDRRIMIGGGDEDFVNAERRDALIGSKALLLRRRFERIFPGIKIEPALAWAGTFGDTKDGLPYIGTTRSHRNILFTLCYGANGTNFAMIGANLAKDWVSHRKNRDAPLFGFNR